MKIAKQQGTLDMITNQMAEGNAVTIAGFGRFRGKGAQETESRRPGQGTGEPAAR